MGTTKEGKVTISVTEAGITVDHGPFQLHEVMGIVEWARTAVRYESLGQHENASPGRSGHDDGGGHDGDGHR